MRALGSTKHFKKRKKSLVMLLVAGACNVSLGVAIGFFGGCSTKRQTLEEAKTSVYQTNFPTIYSEALEVITENYPNLVENPSKGIIKTAWHPLSIRNSGHGADAGGVSQTNTGSLPGNNQGLGFGGAGAAGAAGAGQNTQQNPNNIEVRDERKNYFVRFEVAIVGRNAPFRVRIHGEASSWQTGQIPTPLRGSNIPTWLGPRVDAMKVEIHKRLKKYAVVLEEKEEKVVDEPLVDKKSFAHLGKDAGDFLTKSKSCAMLRDADALKQIMAEDFVWKSNSPGSSTVAAALFEADPERFSQLESALDSQCQKSSDDEIECSAEKRVASFKKTRDGWKFSSFY